MFGKGIIISALASCVFVLFGGSVRANEVAAYPLDGDAVDLSGHGFNGVLHGPTPVADRFGSPGKALSFDGGDRITIADSPSLNITGDLSISAWIKLDTGLGNQADIFSNMHETSPHWGYQLSAPTSNELRFMSGDKSVFASTPLLGEGWIYVVATLSGSTGSIYENGQLIAQGQIAPATYSDAFADPQVIGAASTEGYYFWPGSIDDVRIYDHALSQGEIAALYNVPEPSTLAMLALGFGCLAHRTTSRKKCRQN